MIGLSKSTGKALDGNAHLIQSIADILSTPIGTRIMRRDYGSLIFDLIDRPLNTATRSLVHAASAIAISRWEPRLKLRKVTMDGEPASGRLSITIEGDRTDLPSANAHVSLSIPIRVGGAPTVAP
ncbi:GPW/gp25 family protein [Parasphingorhabdus sp.]|uniref:GPW/gp25 family protein n=1 Tax=Parasphingorhabdus sp. TaxID=2709688 RepID=UPI002F91ED2A